MAVQLVDELADGPLSQRPGDVGVELRPRIPRPLEQALDRIRHGKAAHRVHRLIPARTTRAGRSARSYANWRAGHRRGCGRRWAFSPPGTPRCGSCSGPCSPRWRCRTCWGSTTSRCAAAASTRRCSSMPRPPAASMSSRPPRRSRREVAAGLSRGRGRARDGLGAYYCEAARQALPGPVQAGKPRPENARAGYGACRAGPTDGHRVAA